MSTPDPDLFVTGAAEQLDQCPVCNYCLLGLPVAHRCPECGFEYDEYTRVWRSSRFLDYIGGLMGLLFATAALMVSLMFLLQAIARVERYGLSGWSALRVMMFLAFLVTTVVVMVLPFLRKPFVAVAPVGVLYQSGIRKCIVLPWSQIAAAYTGKANNDAPIVNVYAIRVDVPAGIVDRRKPRLVISGMFRSGKDATDLAVAIEAGIERHRRKREGGGA